MKRGRRSRSVIAIIAACVPVIGLAPVAMAGPPSGSDLSVTISDSPDPVNEGAEVTYTVSVSNAGPASASDVWGQTSVEGGAQFLSGHSSQGTCTGSQNVANCALGSLAKRGAATLTLVFRVLSSSDLTATASAWTSGSQADPKSENNQATTTTSVLADQTPPQTLATCTGAAPLVGCRSLTNLEPARVQVTSVTTVRVTLQPSEQFTGTLVAYLDGRWVTSAGFTNGKLDWGSAEGFLTLYPGAPGTRRILYVEAPDMQMLVHEGGSKTVGVPLIQSCHPHSSPTQVCIPTSYTVDVPRVSAPVPSVGPYQVTVSG